MNNRIVSTLKQAVVILGHHASTLLKRERPKMMPHFSHKYRSPLGEVEWRPSASVRPQKGDFVALNLNDLSIHRLSIHRLVLFGGSV